MPKSVDVVPNLWSPYMDGNIWEFTEAEISDMPRWSPMINQEHRIIGQRMIQWYVNGKYYIRFVQSDDQRSIEELAGWL